MPVIWVLEEGKRWSHRYSFEQDIPRPHFVYDEYVLMCNSTSTSIYVHLPKGMPSSGRELTCDDGVILVGE